MGFRTRTAIGIATALAGLLMVTAPAGATSYDFPSTNDANRLAGHPHVNEVSKGPGTVTLEFVNDTVALAYFEYRIDGKRVGTERHPVVKGDVIHPGVCVEGTAPGAGDFEPPCASNLPPLTFSANSTVEVRLALGGERDWDFDWTEFIVGPPSDAPSSRSDCMNGGWKTYGFRNQGECIRLVNTGAGHG